MMLLTGRTLGRCHLESMLGEGSTAQVYKATHQTLGIPVAVKVLKTHMNMMGERPEFRERFRREAQMAARLNHEGMVRVLDFGEEGGMLYLVMEYLQGRSLLDYLRQKGVLTEEFSLKLVAYLASVMQIAHSQSIIHRDLKPSNILITQSGKLKISDLGLAKELGQIELTAADAAMGTPAYMAPECFTPGKPVDHRADIYSLGVMLYEMLYGRPPFVGTLNQVLYAHLHAEPSWYGEKVTVSEPTLNIIRALLAKDREKRPASCREVTDLCQMRLREFHGAEPSRPSGNGTYAASTLTESSHFHKISAFLEKNLGSRTSEYQGKTVLHTTGRERLIVWALTGLFFLSGLAAFMFLR